MKYTLKDMLYLMRLRGTNTNSESGSSGEGSGSSSSCFWDDPAVVEYLSAGVDVRGSILHTIVQEVNAGLAVPNPDDYVPEQTLAIKFQPAEGYSEYPFAILPCKIDVDKGEEVVEFYFMTSAGSYTYTGVVAFSRRADAETGDLYFVFIDAAITVSKCAIPESGS